jgi:hypothetical protein
MHFMLNNLSPESRRNVGAALVNRQESFVGRKLIEWYGWDRPVDAYMVSFPKCGRTWLRLMVGYIFVNHFCLEHPEIQKQMISLEPLAELHPAVPRIRVTHDDEPHLKMPQELETSKTRYKQSKVIFLARDPRDVVVSAYFEQKKRAAMWLEELKQDQEQGSNIDLNRLEPFQGTISEFLYEDIGSLNSLLRYYNIWADSRTIPEAFLLMRYEDMHENPKRELNRLLKFLDVPNVSDDLVSEAVELASFNNMRKMEVENALDSRHLKPADKRDETSYKTRRGKIGGFVDYFNQAEIAYMDEQISKNLSSFYGYHP